MILKLKNNQRGFSLTEVMIGMTILTVAIVAVTSMLIGLIQSNRNNVQSLQAYYLAVEGLEAVHNVRASNWLHNLDWLDANQKGLWGGENFQIPNSFDDENQYVLTLDPVAFEGTLEAEVETLDALGTFSPWKIQRANANNKQIYKVEDSGILMTHQIGDEESQTPFERVITLTKYSDSAEQFNSSGQEFVLVTSKVTWMDGQNEKEIVLSGVLTNWNDSY